MAGSRILCAGHPDRDLLFIDVEDKDGESVAGREKWEMVELGSWRLYIGSLFK